MPGRSSRATPFGAVAALAWALTLAGCTPNDPLGRAGVTVRPPEGWRPVARATWPVPGTPLAAWSGPGGSSMVVYRSLPVPGVGEGDGAESLAEGLANRLENLPGLRLVRRGTERVGGVPAAFVEVSAPGTGDALAPTGRGEPVAPAGKALQPTRRVVVSIARPGDTLSIVWHAPEAGAEALAAGVRETLKSLSVRRGRLATQTY